jgi:hypothetical protein
MGAEAFVQARGATKRRVSFGLGGALGAAVGSVGKTAAGDPGEALGLNALGHLAVAGDHVVLSKAKNGLKPKPTDEVLLSVPRAAVQRAGLERKTLMGVLTIEFDDGSAWEFDVPRAHMKGADALASELNP